MPLTNEQFSRVMRVYEQRRAAARALQEQRKAEVREKLPRYAGLEQERLALSLERAKASLNGRTAEAGEMEEQLRVLSFMKETVLTQGGYPRDYLEPVYRCRKCSDSGFTDGEPCSCFRATAMNVLNHDSGLWEKVQQENFGNFDLERFSDEPLEELQGRSPRENMARHLETARNYTEHFGENSESLLLMGPVGTGKTYLCNAIAGELLAAGYAILYMTATEYFDHIAALSFGESENRGSFEEAMAAADLLILDDLGMELGGRFTQSTLFRTVNERLLKGQPTIISTNFSLNEIREKYTERVASRLMGSYRILLFAGEDLRLSGRAGAKPQKFRK